MREIDDQDNGFEKVSTPDFRSLVQKSRRESAHAHTFGGDFLFEKFAHARVLVAIFGQAT